MADYRVTGTLFIEGTNDEASYDFIIQDWDDDRGKYGAPSDMDALDYMMQTGIIQIMHEKTVRI